MLVPPFAPEPAPPPDPYSAARGMGSHPEVPNRAAGSRALTEPDALHRPGLRKVGATRSVLPAHELPASRNLQWHRASAAPSRALVQIPERAHRRF